MDTERPGCGQRTYSTAERFEALYDRMIRFRAPMSRICHAWELIVAWRNEIPNLPAPAVFANDEDRIEFEWSLNGRNLTLTLMEAGQVEFYRNCDDYAFEDEGTLSET